MSGSAVAVVAGEVPRALRHAVDVHEGCHRNRADREHPWGCIRCPLHDVAHKRAEPCRELLLMRHVLRVHQGDHHRRVNDAQKARDEVPPVARVVDEYGALLARAPVDAAAV